ncbi:hypothetical protein ESD82_04960 [Paracoccus pantotrophus]|uniref:Transposase n=1 Tax=Paracoccus pantotrophus TaxID=82367 RepID=A0AAE6NUU8_PARPN|nr:hypothetical protein [Paracoccus pantotrophus]QFG35527.1 hypothetical protein ESD82_04960 [Paracoccus pantotrophus]
MQQMTRPLHNEGHAVNVTRSRRLMRLMRLMPIRRKPAASRPAPGRKTYPLGGARVEQPDQVGCAGIADLPMRRGCLCPVAVMDRFPRKLLAWRISNTPAADFCVAHPHLDGWQGRCLDTVFIERLRRSLMHECAYPHAWETGAQARAGAGRWIAFCSHQSGLAPPMADSRPPRSASTRAKPTGRAGEQLKSPQSPPNDRGVAQRAARCPKPAAGFRRWRNVADRSGFGIDHPMRNCSLCNRQQIAGANRCSRYRAAWRFP